MSSIKLYGFAKPDGRNSPSTSGSCQKLETFLRATSFRNYTLEDTMPWKGPKGKLPYIELTLPSGEMETIPDTHFILRHLVSHKIIADVDARLTPAQKAENLAWSAWVEEKMQYASSIMRFRHHCDVWLPRLMIPSFVLLVLGWYIRRSALGTYHTLGMGRYTDDEVKSLLVEYLDALEARLEGSEFFHGDEPTSVDCVTVSFMMNALAERKSNPEYATMLLERRRLRRYIEVLTKRWFPEYEDILNVVGKNE